MKKQSVALFSLLVLVFIGCAGQDGEQGPPGEAGPPGEVSQENIDSAVEAALAEPEAEVGGTLVVYSGRKESLVSDLIAEFESKFGVDVDAVVVSDGVGYSAESTLRLADIYSFTDNEGLFLGSSIEGSYLQPRNDLNRFLYKQEFDSEEILKSNEPRIEINNIIKIIQKEF